MLLKGKRAFFFRCCLVPMALFAYVPLCVLLCLLHDYFCMLVRVLAFVFKDLLEWKVKQGGLLLCSWCERSASHCMPFVTFRSVAVVLLLSISLLLLGIIKRKKSHACCFSTFCCGSVSGSSCCQSRHLNI